MIDIIISRIKVDIDDTKKVIEQINDRLENEESYKYDFSAIDFYYGQLEGLNNCLQYLFKSQEEEAKP